MITTVVSVSHSSSLLFVLISQANAFIHRSDGPNHALLRTRSTELEHHDPKFIIFACLIPVLVLLSGVFAGLTLGYMSLDETQLSVLSISGTPQQREYANKIKPIRKNGHLLLVTLLLANMIVNESLPVISDPILGGGVQSVVVSTVLIVIFAEIIPQSIFTRHGLYLGAKMAGPTKGLIYILGIVAWPVAKLLEFVLGPHHGIIYRRAELKELIAMHSHGALNGGDLKTDTVTIIGATLDLQEKVVKQAMTPIEDVFMLSIDSKLDYELLKKICLTGHSRVPVYDEVEVPVEMHSGQSTLDPYPGIGSKSIKNKGERMVKVKKIIGILLVKQCVLLDPKDAVPLRKIPLNKVPFVPNNEPLLGILDKFQEGRSHMAIVSRFSVEKAASVKQAVKRGLTKRLMERVGMGDSSDEEGDDGKRKKDKENGTVLEGEAEKDRESTLREDGVGENGIPFANGKRNHNASTDKEFTSRKRWRGSKRQVTNADLEMGVKDAVNDATDGEKEDTRLMKARRASFQLPVPNLNMSMVPLEQSMPADAVLAKEGAKEFLQGFDPAVMPLGIITLEDVLEELIGEEIYDEFDPQGANAELSYVPSPPSTSFLKAKDDVVPRLGEDLVADGVSVAKSGTNILVPKPATLMGLDFLRSKSAPPRERGINATPVLNAQDDTHFVAECNSAGLIAKPSVGKANGSPSITTPIAVKPETDASRYTPLSSSSEGQPTPDVNVDWKNSVLGSNTVGDALGIPFSNASGSSPALSAPISRAVSPASSLEAILLDRKRRLNASAGAGVSPGVSPSFNSGSMLGPIPPPPGALDNRPRMAIGASVKGTMFKSSPLGARERIGVVAEKIKEGTGAEDGSGIMRAEEGADEV